MEDWALIRRLVAEGVPKARIAERLGISRTTVVKMARASEPPSYGRTPTDTSFVTVEPRVRALLEEFSDLPASVLAERVGWTGSPSWFRENVARIRPDYRRVDPADRLTWEPGDAIQCDLWFPPCAVPLEDGSTPLLPVLVMTLAHSRFMLARMIPTRTTEDLLLGTWELLSELGRVPRRLIWDNEGGIGRRGRLAEGVGSFMGTLATRLVQLPARDPESKGIIERRNGFFETSFLPGRRFASPADFNSSPTGWAGPTPEWCAPCASRPPIASSRTARACSSCPHGPCTWAGTSASASLATTTCAWTRATTRSTRAPSGVWWT